MQNLVVVGLGSISSRHRKNLTYLYPDAAVYAMAASGRVPEEAIQDADGVLFSIADVIALRPEMVIVASPAPLHATHAVPLIEAGIPVLIEKPLAMTNSDAAAIVRAVEQFRTPVAVGYCLRQLPSAKHLKLLLEKGGLGVLYNAYVEVGQYLPDWRPNKNYHDSVSAKENLGGGALLELSHELDYVEWMLGRLEPKYATLRSSTELGLDVEDLVDLVAVNSCGVVVNIHLDFLQRQAYRKCRFIGSRGSLEWDLIHNQITVTTDSTTEIVFSNGNKDTNQIYLRMLQDFEQLIRGQYNEAVSVSEAKNTVELVNKIRTLTPIERF